MTQAYRDYVDGTAEVGMSIQDEASLQPSNLVFYIEGLPLEVKTMKVNGNNLDIVGYFNADGVSYYGTVIATVTDGKLTGTMKVYKESTLLITCSMNYLQTEAYEEDETSDEDGLDTEDIGVEDENEEVDFTGSWFVVMHIPSKNVDWDTIGVLEGEAIPADEREDITTSFDTLLYESDGQILMEGDSTAEISVDGNQIKIVLMDEEGIVYSITGTLSEDQQTVYGTVDLMIVGQSIANGSVTITRN